LDTTLRWAQRIRDPVHGLIVFGGNGNRDRHRTDQIAWNLINTPEFQRLRRIRQLGFSDLVFPGATHSRFAHSLGVYHIARRLADVIARQRQDCDGDRERVALLAALLHDIGHGPFSHAFEQVGTRSPRKTHEDWSAQIVRDDITQVNRILRDEDEELPEQIGALLKEEEPKDIYATMVSSQFDADRLDYIQRDRMHAGLESGHVDSDWLFDCLEVDTVTIGDNSPYEAPCLCLGPKGVSVAEEYLEARFRLYRMVYMHKTTRAAERMLEKLLNAVAKAGDSKPSSDDPVLRYLTSDSPTIGTYMELDDAAMWSSLHFYRSHPDEQIARLAERLRDRNLYKCVDIGAREESGGNLYLRFRRELSESSIEWRDDLIFDDSTVTPYRWYNFEDASALSKVLVKTDNSEPRDIASISRIVASLQKEEQIRRVYAPNSAKAGEILKIVEGLRH
jgi:HD superfamily phosphohydrolase